jgi:hypothetical protein
MCGWVKIDLCQINEETFFYSLNTVVQFRLQSFNILSHTLVTRMIRWQWTLFNVRARSKYENVFFHHTTIEQKRKMTGWILINSFNSIERYDWCCYVETPMIFLYSVVFNSITTLLRGLYRTDCYIDGCYRWQ